jgi:hypothetical protein
MARTTPPRPTDITEVFPELAGMARTATRLHPCPGEPTVHDSSVGGPLLWPADEPWPEWKPGYPPVMPWTTLAEVRERRALLTRAWARPHGPGDRVLTPQESETLSRIEEGHQPEELPPGPQPLIPVAQLYARDVPDLAFPEGTDLLQVLWAPSYAVEGKWSAVQLRWRLASDVREVLSAAPEPAYAECADFVPEPCVLQPEAVRELPPHHELPEELGARVLAWVRERESPSYWSDLSVAQGWKAGGWPANFTFRDPALPEELHCGECAGPVEALLSIDSNEWDGEDGSWQPILTGADVDGPPGHPYRTWYEPTMVSIGRGYTLQIYRCVSMPSHVPCRIMQ